MEVKERTEAFDLYRDIAERTDGEIHIGVVGPVRTGKSTFITRFMEQMVVPMLDNAHKRERAVDALPVSGSGRTIMTTQPNFVPDEAAEITVGGTQAQVRLVDCVGYLVKGVLGTQENDVPRMVHTPWFDEDVPFEQAAEVGTRKVIADHSTIGLVVTTDGSITDIPRSAYAEAEERVVRELKQMGKPFAIVVNSAAPGNPETRKLRDSLEEKYDAPVVALDAKTMDSADIDGLLEQLLLAFPLREVQIELPSWVQALDEDHWLLQSLFQNMRGIADQSLRMRDEPVFADAFSASEYAEPIMQGETSLATGTMGLVLPLKDGLFNRILGEECGTEIHGDAHLLSLLKELVAAKTEYDRIADALASVRETGYGLVTPTLSDLKLQNPEIVKQGNRFGVRLKASAPSLHMIKTDITTEVTPVIGSEQQSEEFARSLMEDFDNDPTRLWDTNFFGKSLHEMVREGLNTKLSQMPGDTQEKLQEMLSKIVNEGNGGMIAILL
ncbi:MAG: stage IV sporulation protein A [Oscillospiraceae bacterium]|nr:stage IV sporulation protein A [Oscillospiraceae bacterium]